MEKRSKRWEAIPAVYARCALYLNGNGVSKDANLGVEYLKKSAEQDWKGSLELLCYLYVFGDADNNVEKDFVEAKKWCEIAASKDVANAYYNLGVMHNDGLGVEKNKSKANSWFGRACNNGINAGCDEYKNKSATVLANALRLHIYVPKLKW
ncbi:hypothetical protein MASR2M36_33360 [Providencia sp.]